MANPKIIIRRSATPNKVPTENQLSLGELAINTYDGKLYLEQDQTSTGLGVTVISVNPWGVGVGSTAFDVYFTSGKVGVGLTNPTYTLEVSGNARVSGIISTTNLQIHGTVSAGNTTGKSGQYLKSTGVGVAWADFPTLRTVGIETATQGQTAFSFQYNQEFIDVFVNGVKLSSSEFIANDGSTITLKSPAFNNDIVEFLSYNTVSFGSGAQGAQGYQGTIGAQGYQGTIGAQGAIGAQGVQGPNYLTVTEYSNRTGSANTTITNVSELRFNNAAGFNVEGDPLIEGAGVAFVDLGSSFNPWYVNGENTLKATGEEPIEFIAGPGIAITTKAVASVGIGTTFAKAITFNVTNESQWVKTNAGIHTLSNVGVGTTNPQTPLQIENIYGLKTGTVQHTSRVGIASAIDSFDTSTINFLTAEYTVHVGYGTYIQSQKVLVMHNGEYAYSQEYGVMYQPNLIVSFGSTMSGTTVTLQATPETGISGVTTYRYVRETIK